jgi:hypothetical protein
MYKLSSPLEPLRLGSPWPVGTQAKAQPHCKMCATPRRLSGHADFQKPHSDHPGGGLKWLRYQQAGRPSWSGPPAAGRRRTRRLLASTQAARPTRQPAASRVVRSAERAVNSGGEEARRRANPCPACTHRLRRRLPRGKRLELRLHASTAHKELSWGTPVSAGGGVLAFALESLPLRRKDALQTRLVGNRQTTP